MPEGFSHVKSPVVLTALAMAPITIASGIAFFAFGISAYESLGVGSATEFTIGLIGYIWLPWRQQDQRSRTL
ncbi:MAG: hypothetical protein JJ900_02165 [Rhodospirillales bacterium]|nr:hypothetical protein [Rhodospirillales bacterium]MBO6785627.1 hypothetical protein [Rhodospirillales bacterium]